MLIGITSALSKFRKTSLPFIKDNLKLYLDFKSNKSDTLKFPSEGSTSLAYTDKIMFSQQTFTGAFSVVCWFNGDVNTYYKRLFGDSSPPSGTNDILVKDVDGQISIRINGSYKANINNVPNNTWSHLAFTRDDNGNIKSYLNGVQSSTSTSTDTFTLDNIGGDGGGAVMSMCNAGLWSRELSPEEIQSIMNKSYSQLKGVEKTSLVMWQSLDRNASSGVHNSGYANSAIPETLGSELVKSDIDGDDWTDHGTNQVTVDNGVFTITRGNSNFGSRARFTSSGILTETTVNTKIYKASWTSYITGSGTALLPFSFHTSHYDHQLPVNTTSPQDYEVYFIGGGSGSQQIQFNTPSNVSTVVVSNLSVKEVTSAGFGVQVFPASTSTDSDDELATTTSVYGGNAPILPRAVDVAKEGQADAIGNGSARFNTVNVNGTDRVSIEKTLVLGTNDFTMTAWANSIGGDSGYQGVVSIGTATNNQSAYMGILASNEWGFGLFGANYDFGYTVVNGEWHHLAMTREGSNIKLYFNGILVDTQSAGSLDITDGGTHIASIGDNDTYNFNGDISQVGIWQGALTQSQIQSVMESTSYSKIPSSVKSTLGADLFTDSTFDLSGTQSASTTGTHWTTGSAWTISNGEAIYDATAHENRLELPSSTFKDAGIYKFSFTVSDANTKAGIKIKAGGNDIIPTAYYDNGSHVIYYHQANAYGSAKTLKIEGRNDVHGAFKLQSASWKLVTNDIVAYYPLDGSSSANGVTQDVTTGETLGSELISNGSFDTDTTGWIKNNGSMDVVNGELKVITSSSYWEGVRYNFGAVVSGGIYKAVFTARLESGNTPQIQFSGASGSSTYSNATSISGSSNVTYTFYFIANANNSNTYLTFFNGTASSSTFYLDNVSLKKVTSNTGVLK